MCKRVFLTPFCTLLHTLAQPWHSSGTAWHTLAEFLHTPAQHFVQNSLCTDSFVQRVVQECAAIVQECKHVPEVCKSVRTRVVQECAKVCKNVSELCQSCARALHECARVFSMRLQVCMWLHGECVVCVCVCAEAAWCCPIVVRQC